LDFAKLTQKLQEERAAVALSFFVKSQDNLTNTGELDK
jgi:hypothetical protein